MSSADNLSEQFRPRSFDTLIVFLKEFFGKVKFEKLADDYNSMQNYPECTEVKGQGLFQDWEKKYIHPNYSKSLEENAVIEQVRYFSIRSRRPSRTL